MDYYMWKIRFSARETTESIWISWRLLKYRHHQATIIYIEATIPTHYVFIYLWFLFELHRFIRFSWFCLLLANLQSSKELRIFKRKKDLNLGGILLSGLVCSTFPGWIAEVCELSHFVLHVWVRFIICDLKWMMSSPSNSPVDSNDSFS